MKALCGRAAKAFVALVRLVGVGGGGAGSLGLNEAEPAVALLRRLAANSRTKAGMSSFGRYVWKSSCVLERLVATRLGVLLSGLGKIGGFPEVLGVEELPEPGP